MTISRSPVLAEHAPAKINLSLRVLGRRADGYHTLESIVVFADVGDRLTLAPGETAGLTVQGPRAAATGEIGDNLVLRAARGLAKEIPHLTLGHFTLAKRLPVAAGIGGGSSDAAAALRLLARANGMAADDERLFAVARSVGADVPVCVEPKGRWMRGVGEVLSPPLMAPRLAAVLVNPGVPLETRHVFAELARAKAAAGRSVAEREAEERPDDIPAGRDAFVAFLAELVNDLEPPAVALQPAIADVLAALRAAPGCGLARMSGSGPTCFGLFSSQRAAAAAAQSLLSAHPGWWVRATTLG